MTAILEHPVISQYEEETMENLATLSVGGGSEACHIDYQGLYMGSDEWEDAPFRVDMHGNTRMNNADIRGTISGLATDVIAQVITPSGDFVSKTLNMSTKTILKDFTFAGYEGALKTGNIRWNTQDGTLSGGTGILINNSGILGAKNGSATFSITTDGEATFAGKLESPSGKLGTITAGTIIGATIKSANTGSRTEITSGGVIKTIDNNNTTRIKIQQEQLVFYDSSGSEAGYMYGYSSHQLGLNGALSVGGDITTTGADINGNADISGTLRVRKLYVNGERIDPDDSISFIADTGVGIQLAINGSVYHLQKV